MWKKIREFWRFTWERKLYVLAAIAGIVGVWLSSANGQQQFVNVEPPDVYVEVTVPPPPAPRAGAPTPRPASPPAAVTRPLAVAGGCGDAGSAFREAEALYRGGYMGRAVELYRCAARQLPGHLLQRIDPTALKDASNSEVQTPADLDDVTHRMRALLAPVSEELKRSR